MKTLDNKVNLDSECNHEDASSMGSFTVLTRGSSENQFTSLQHQSRYFFYFTFFCVLITHALLNPTSDNKTNLDSECNHEDPSSTDSFTVLTRGSSEKQFTSLQRQPRYVFFIFVCVLPTPSSTHSATHATLLLPIFVTCVLPPTFTFMF